MRPFMIVLRKQPDGYVASPLGTRDAVIMICIALASFLVIPNLFRDLGFSFSQLGV